MGTMRGFCSHANGNGNKCARNGNSATGAYSIVYKRCSHCSHCSHEKTMKFQMQNTFIAQLLENSTPAADPGAGDRAQASVPLAIEKATERLRLGSFARPRPVSGTRMPSVCPWWPNCDGHLTAHGHNLHLCSTCETWFEFLFDAGDTTESAI